MLDGKLIRISDTQLEVLHALHGEAGETVQGQITEASSLISDVQGAWITSNLNLKPHTIHVSSIRALLQYKLIEEKSRYTSEVNTYTVTFRITDKGREILFKLQSRIERQRQGGAA